jgi:hypothetical protein
MFCFFLVLLSVLQIMNITLPEEAVEVEKEEVESI